LYWMGLNIDIVSTLTGSPYAYFPLSLQQPWQADAMIEKQKVSELEAVKWLEQKRKSRGKEKEQQGQDRGNKRGGGVLEEDGSAGNDIGQQDKSGIEFVSSHNEDSEMKDVSSTSGKAQKPSDDDLKVDGPITNHRAIDQEYEAPFTEQNKNQTTEDKVAEVEKAERDAASPSQQSAQAIKTSDTHPISISAVIPPELLIEFTHYVKKGLPAGVRQEVESKGALSEIILAEHCSKQIEEKRLIRCYTTNVDLCDVAQKAEKEMIEAAQSKRRARPLAFQDSWRARMNPTDTSYLQVTCTNYDDADDEANDAIPVAFGGHYRGFTIGNLLLSSCPGKKVRLTGPIRGRGAICRNLGLDLTRIKQLGVGALICCLDDEELTFLGAPWTLYEKEADRLGIEVIRLPMAEGFCPTDVELTDNIITSVVEQYTLRGVNILVHCRGGVGRAGLVACTWMVKLGLVQLHDDAPPHDASPAGEYQGKTIDQLKEEKNQEDMMKLCRRLIDTIRKRRSPKAIETAEQVAFLVKYITFILRQEAQRRQQSGQYIKS
jgi:protein-tyrosine phosphatase